MAKKQFSDILDVELFGKFFEENRLHAPTDVQVSAIAPFVAGKNIQVLAKTGSGKTFSYLLPLFQMLKLSEKEKTKDSKAQKGSPRAIIVVPIKELAIQVQEEAKKVSHHIKMRVRVALGGDKGKKVSDLKNTEFDILIGGPGRIKSMLDRGEINLENLEHFIIDEADQLMEMGFSQDMKGIRKHFKRPFQAALFSATSSESFDNLRVEFFSGITFDFVNVGITNALVSKIDTFNITLNYQEKNAMLTEFVKKEAKGSGIIFVNQKETVTAVYKFLKENFKDLKVSELHGDMNASERKKAFEKYKTTGGILVTSDLFARGIDIKGLVWILNYDLPFEAVYYVHRSGRVGRNGAYGRVYNFVTSKDVPLVSKINEAIFGQTALKIDAISIKKTAFAKGGAAGSKASKKVERRDSKPKKTPRFAKEKAKEKDKAKGGDKTKKPIKGVMKKVTTKKDDLATKKGLRKIDSDRTKAPAKKIKRHINKRT